MRVCQCCGGVSIPSAEEIARASAEIERENRATQDYYNSPAVRAIVADTNRRSNLPSEHPEHICGVICDGADGNGYCNRIRAKLFGGRR